LWYLLYGRLKALTVIENDEALFGNQPHKYEVLDIHLYIISVSIIKDECMEEFIT
jgi:hypothetical protein